MVLMVLKTRNEEGAPVSVVRGRWRSFWREVEDARVSDDVTTRGPLGSGRKEGGAQVGWRQASGGLRYARAGKKKEREKVGLVGWARHD